MEHVSARTGAQQKVKRRRRDQHSRYLQAAPQAPEDLPKQRERLGVAVEERREAFDEEELRDLACAVLDDPLHRDCAEEAALRGHADRGEERLIAEHGRDGRERRLEKLKHVEGHVP